MVLLIEFENKTKMKFVTEDIHELKEYTDNVKAINESNKVVDYINNHFVEASLILLHKN